MKHIHIISTARAISEKELIEPINLLISWGFKVSTGSHLYNVHHQFAGTTSDRSHDLQRAINDPDIDIILFARGGYGTVKVVDTIDFSSLKDHPKLFVGYSDVTVLLSHLHNTMKIHSLHATMPINFNTNTEASLTSLKRCLNEQNNEITIAPHNLNRFGKASGQLVGGNLSILYSLIGSISDINTDNKILFIEDLDEYLYHLDRMMMNMKRSGKLKNLSALVVGAFTDMNDNNIAFGLSAYKIILDAVSEYQYPVIFNFPSGHITDNRALYVGVESKLEVTDSFASLKQSL